MSAEYVQAKIRRFEKRFKELKIATRESLKRKGVTVEQVADALTSLPADDVEEHKQFLESQSRISALYQATDHSELFAAMTNYWNYLSYHLLDFLIQDFELEGVKGEMETYKADLQRFRMKTPLKLFYKSQKKRHIEPPPKFSKVVAKFEWPDDVTLEVVEQFRQEYACYYSLRECAMMLAVVLPGSFVITWFIPNSIVEKLKMKIPIEVLKKNCIVKLEIAGVCVYPEPTHQVHNVH